MFTPSIILIIATATLFAVSFVAIRGTANRNGFYLGLSAEGAPPQLLTLVLSQVTTWIFARSLLNAAILGFYYGIWGTLAYSVYYLSFFTGGLIVDSLRFRHNAPSVQAFLTTQFGTSGARCYNFVIGIRLISEIFANLLVIGLLFGAVGGTGYVIAIILFSALTLGYAATGGMRASLNTDSAQMALFGITLILLAALMFTHENFMADTLLYKSFDISSPGVVLIAVALLQVWSYPMHDPVMMDRGFLTDRTTTRRSFIHAGWLSFICIFLFGLLGVFAGAAATDGEDMKTALTRLLGEWPMLLFSLSLIISAMSTLDSTLSSSAKLVVVDMKKLPQTLVAGRTVMVLFMLSGVLLVFLGSKDLFGAVAVSGTASMYLAPVIFFNLWGGVRNIPTWSYLTSFCIAIIGAGLYFTETGGYSDLITPFTGIAHKYAKLLLICIVVLIVGCGAFAVGKLTAARPKSVESFGG